VTIHVHLGLISLHLHHVQLLVLLELGDLLLRAVLLYQHHDVRSWPRVRELRDRKGGG
jgi:hypothetical protein